MRLNRTRIRRRNSSSKNLGVESNSINQLSSAAMRSALFRCNRCVQQMQHSQLKLIFKLELETNRVIRSKCCTLSTERILENP